MSSWTKELDEAAVLATKTGSWHVLLFYLLCGLAAFPTSFLVFSQVFTNATPDHWCAPPPELEGLELPEGLLRNLTVPQHEGVYESCSRYALDTRALFAALHVYVDERTEIIHEGGVLRTIKTCQLIPAKEFEEREKQISRIVEAITLIRSKPTGCLNGWRFSTEQYEVTLVTEFSLVCEKEWLPRTGYTLFWVGSIFGNLFFGWMSDRYGRRPTILLMIYLEVPLAIAACFPSSYMTYIVLRVLGGLFFPAMYQLPFILALELMPPARRTHAGIIVGMFFASGMSLLAIIAYIVRDWFYLSLATSLPFITLYGFYWLIPESPRWLVGRGRIAEAEKVLRSLAKKNGIELSQGILFDIHKKIKYENFAEEKSTMLSSINGNTVEFPEVRDRNCADHIIGNMLTLKPDVTNVSENVNDNVDKESLLLNKNVGKKGISNTLENNRGASTRELRLNEQLKQSLKMNYRGTSLGDLKSKTRQLVTRIFLKGDNEDNVEMSANDDQELQEDCKASILDLFRYPNIRKNFFILTFDWLSLGVIYNGLSYNTSNLGVNDYLAFFIGGVVELPSYIIAWHCMERFGRRWVLCIFMCIGGLACLSCVLVPEDRPWLTVCLAMLGRLCGAASFAVFYVLIGEFLPTVLRSQAMGLASFISGLGLLACPYVVHLAVYGKSLPLIIMGILSVMAGISSLFLPETLNQPLPQTLEDGEMFGRDFKLFSCVDRSRKEQDYNSTCTN
ncbi:unnamed protein product [Parnassius mnemosyne]|uniref:Major facilitator superfamily (MFS) profile domain-containing protein n=1 Tax=Parnassius mnemosyne TaxID=213953 RepID=A0AAV1LBC9_9NEOP